MKNSDKLKKKEYNNKINIFYYLNYRDFLSDLFHYKKENEGFTLRHFSYKAGFSSHAFLKQIIMGIRHVSIKAVWKISKGFSLSQKETEFLEYLVRFNLAEDMEEKNEYYKKIIKLRPKDEIARFEEDHFFLLSKWYNMAIREMVTLPDFKEDYEWIAKNLYPKITKNQAKEAIEILLKLNYLVRDEDGKLIQSSPDITTGEEIRSLHAIIYHNTIFELASYALKKTGAKFRDVSSIVIPVDDNEFNYIKERIKEFRKEIIQYLRDKKKEAFSIDNINRERVLYNLSIQFFNLSKNKWKK